LLCLVIIAPAAFGSDNIQLPNHIYRVAMDQSGNMRLLSPDLNGRYADEPRSNEYVVELASIESVAYLQETLDELQYNVGNMEDRLALLEDTVANLSYESINDRLTLIEELIDSLSIIDLEESVADLLDRVLLLEELVDSIPISILEESIAGIANRLTLLEDLVEELPDTDLEQSIADLNDRLALLEEIVDNLSSGQPQGPVPILELASGTGVNPPEDPGDYTDVTWIQLESGLWVQDLNGTSSKVTIANSESLESLGDGNFTIMFWVVVDEANPNYKYAVSNLNGGNNGWNFQWRTGGTMQANMNSTSESDLNLSLGSGANDGGWHQFAITRDGANYSGYKEGALVIGPWAGPENSISNTRGVKLGVRADSDSGWMDGRIALVQIYNDTLTEQQILDLYSSQKGLFGV